MSEEIYRQLAARLDSFPNGFTPTESGVELRLLAKIFAPEEAALAAQMFLSPEPAASIAERAGMPLADARKLFKVMLRKGQIGIKKGDGQLLYHLLPFVVGIYEEQIAMIDAEMAALFEEYFLETQGGSITGHLPSIHRVLPVQESIANDLEIFPYESAHHLLEAANSWGVRDCICRVQKNLIDEGCDHPVENCLIFTRHENAFINNPTTRPISKEEAFKILGEAHEAGLVHSTGNYRNKHNYICNCCTCSCGVLRSVAEFDIPTAVARSDFWAVVDEDICNGCEDCVPRCQFNALTVDDVCAVDHARCVGCAVCVEACTTDALYMERKPEDQRTPMPDNMGEWLAERSKARNLPPSDKF